MCKQKPFAGKLFSSRNHIIRRALFPVLAARNGLPELTLIRSHNCIPSAVRTVAIATCVFVLVIGESMAQTNGGFSVSAALWPSSRFPVGNINRIILAGQIRNESEKDAIWRGMESRSVGYGQVRAFGTQAFVCETPRTDERIGTWEKPFAIGTSTPYRYDFGALSCNALAKHTGAVEARFCVNPHMFSPLPDETCSEWVQVNIDPVAAQLIDDDRVFRTEMGRFEQTGDLDLQRQLLGVLLSRAIRAQPSAEKVKLHPVGTPNDALARLWLEFFKSEDAVLRAQKPTRMPVTNVIPLGGYRCWPRQTDPHPCAESNSAEDARYQKELEKNRELIKQWNHFRDLEDAARNSIMDLGMWMGSQYRHNKEAREELYAEAKAMGLPDEQVSELRRFLEFANPHG